MTPLTPTILTDANILYRDDLTNLFIHLALNYIVALKWTDLIHQEWTINLSANRPDLPHSKILRRRDFMNNAMPDATVAGYEHFIPTLSDMPDPNDRHVVAAAILGGAETIVTFNLKDFPSSILNTYNLTASHPNQFLIKLYDADPILTADAVNQARRALKKPRYTWLAYLQALTDAHLPDFAQRLQQHHYDDDC